MKTLTSFLFVVFVAIGTAFADGETIIISGTVMDTENELLYGVNVISCEDAQCNTKLAPTSRTLNARTDIDGKFALKDVPSDAYVQFTYVGYETLVVPATEAGGEIKLLKSSTALKDVVVKACAVNSTLLNCVVERDIKAMNEIDVVGKGETAFVHGYQLDQLSQNLKQNLQDAMKNFVKKCENLKGTDYVKDVDTLIGDDSYKDMYTAVLPDNFNLSNLQEYAIVKCEVNSCDDNFVLNDYKCKECTIDNFFSGTEHIESVHVVDNQCVIKECEDKFGVIDGKCVQNDCTDKQLSELNAKSGDINNGVCVPTDCQDGLFVNQGKCVKCEKSLFADVSHVVSVKIDENQCVIDKCESGYELTNGRCLSGKDLETKQKSYEDARAKEQSLANRSLTAATTAATGLGAMQLAQGLSEQKADKEAAADMAAYIETMRCEYGNGKTVKAGRDEIELLGGNDEKLGGYRAEYFALANDLKMRKTALGMKPGIESEEILDKSNSGLYDDENTGITGGNEASLYRAQMSESTADQEKLDELSAISQKRVKGGAIAAGAGVVGGAVGNSLINGKLGEMIKSIKKNKSSKGNEETISLLKRKLKDSGVKNVDKLDLSGFDISLLKEVIQNKDFSNLKGKDITSLINNTSDRDQFVNQFTELLK